jgi:hypothetical protein
MRPAQRLAPLSRRSRLPVGRSRALVPIGLNVEGLDFSLWVKRAVHVADTFRAGILAARHLCGLDPFHEPQRHFSKRRADVLGVGHVSSLSLTGISHTVEHPIQLVKYPIQPVRRDVRYAAAMSGNSGGTVANLKPWKPGQSGNPAGRPKGIARTVREKCGGDPGLLVDALMQIAETGTLPNGKAANGTDIVNSLRALIEHGWGKAPAFAAIEGADPLEQDEVAGAIQAIADELSARREQAA